MIDIKIGDSLYKISCPESEKERVLEVAKNLDKRFCKLAAQLKNCDEKTLLIYTALSCEAEAMNSKSPNSDIQDAVSENIENIAQYIEKLGQKISNY